jgi:TRAP transporter TAXI family solute receptor
MSRASTCQAPARRAVLAGLATFAAGLSLPVRAEATPLTLATSTPGGGFSQYGETLASVLNRRAGRTLVQALPSKGTGENLTLLAQGRVDAALIQGTVASEILSRPDADGLRILFAMYPSPGMLAVPAASSLQRLDEVRGRKVVLGVRTSGLVTLGRQIFDGIGIDVDRDLQAIYVDKAAQSPELVLSGQAEGLWGAGEGWPGFVRLDEAPGGARFIGPSPEQIPGILERYPLLKAMEVPPGGYAGIRQPLPTVGSVNLILARPGLDDARAAAFVQAMQAAVEELAQALPQAAFSTLKNTLASAPEAGLLHPVLRGMR